MKSLQTGFGSGGAEGNRTPDLVIANERLHHLTRTNPTPNFSKTPLNIPKLRKTAQRQLRNLCGQDAA